MDAAVVTIAAAPGGAVCGFAGDFGTAAAAEAVLRHHPNIEITANELGIFEPTPFEDIRTPPGCGSSTLMW